MSEDTKIHPSPTIVWAGGPSLPAATLGIQASTSVGPPAKGMHIAAIVSLILTLFIFVGASTCVFRTSLSLNKLLQRHRGHPEESEGRKGGARKLRKMLVIGLLLSDCMIAVGSFWPAVTVLAHKSLGGSECDLPGFLLASALWWWVEGIQMKATDTLTIRQYGFSLTIAVTTYVALRHPLSLAKDLAERGATPIVAMIIVVGGVQAITWRVVNGFHAWRDTCYYAPPSFVSAELIQFLPRLITSLVITMIYIPLIHFLRRPDMTSLYLSPRPASTLPHPPTIDDPTPPGQTPPWEKLTFPTFHLEDSSKDSSGILGPGLGFANAFLPSKSRSRPSTPQKGLRGGLRRLTISDSPTLIQDGSPSGRLFAARVKRSRPSTAPSCPTEKLQTTMEAPSLSVGSPGLRPPSPLQVIKLPLTFDKDLRPPHQRPSFDSQATKYENLHDLYAVAAEDRKADIPFHQAKLPETPAYDGQPRDHSPAGPRPAVDTVDFPTSPINQRLNKAALSNNHFDWQRSPTKDSRHETGHSRQLQVTMLRPTLTMGSEASARDCASFRGMLEMSPGGYADLEASEPKSTSNQVKSLASIMNRSASSFLLWFPLTHLVICALTIARYAGYAATRDDGPALEALTTLVVLGQSTADVVIFGFVERRTRHKYRNKVDECTQVAENRRT
ncbi:hypothetical protein BD324DRAFT_476410 [Kockovaella imperatae]|uniref:Uncharacterized protein n=1 Tax=Kockovaella imperatae TaxID=4999 RepID=A0A1Y1UFQ4_9TREE|nr:hypothetical protein BD324DRAFT_476410 [Kockovaella imperatae]ORX36891.1 hypothetical protein BD324DRAFT_476410 [Kockovaella imperatae]